MKKIRWNIIFSRFVIAMAAAVVLAVLIPVFVWGQFRIGGNSMSPTLHEGDHVLVEKLLMGARIYTDYDFSSPEMECFRMPGFRGLRPGDLAVFNCPQGRDGEKIEFRINYVYVKRCIGCPGDTIRIENACYLNSSCPEKIIGCDFCQKVLASMSDDELAASGVVIPAFPFDDSFGWTVKDFGPLYVPGRGDEIEIDCKSMALYGRLIEYETGEMPSVRGGKVILSGRELKRYVFMNDWFFFGGDNVLNSKDSRYMGLVPDDYVVGIATRILFSRDPHTGRFDWNRFMIKL